MLWDASSIRGYSVLAAGDQAGTVVDFIVDDRDWTIASLVVETGTWLSHRRVCAPTSAFAQPVVQTQQIALGLSSAELDTCPAGEPAQLGANLHSLVAIDKAAVEGTDGPVGQVEAYLVDTGNWRIRYLVINPSEWLSQEKILVPAQTIVGLDDAPPVLKLRVTRQFVKDGPHYDPVQTVDGAYDDTFLTYYGIRFLKT